MIMHYNNIKTEKLPSMLSSPFLTLCMLLSKQTKNYIRITYEQYLQFHFSKYLNSKPLLCKMSYKLIWTNLEALSSQNQYSKKIVFHQTQ